MLTIPNPRDQALKIATNIIASSSGDINIDTLPVLREMVNSIAIIDVDLYRSIDTTIKQALFPALATDEAFIINTAFRDTNNQIQRKPSTFASGIVIFLTSETTTIQSGTELITTDGNLYKTTITRDAVLQQFAITSLQRIDNYVFASVSGQNLANALPITITGSPDATLNGVYDIEVVNSNTIKYKNSGTNTALITDNLIGSFMGAFIEVSAVNFGVSGNKDYNQSIDLAGITNFVENTYVSFKGISGGSDTETIQSLNYRTQQFLRNPQNKGNKSAIETFILQNTNVNYCYSYKTEDDNKIYFKLIVNQFDETTIQFQDFNPTELTTIKNLVLNNNYLNLSTSAIDFSVENPSKKTITVAITSLTPNTIDMQNEVKKNIIKYINLLPIKRYLDANKVELSVDKIRNIVLNTRDKNGNIASCSNLTISGVSAIAGDSDKANIETGNITFV
jgi:hypothetical protein